ncbi:hypothetical protein CONCODRAFT_80031 [Conidiobolus coronatus NRRL 28638]|uniref:Uncharacterized protein n=1 Tax=Conidiobolus coronatus (strain ATCC 28846 / CBS 209.66 / NRRL 28638) TaxID=796925 RepID=A0A137NXV9_CONC2|nr:hypothetical protein CONCODRAFT_80031 [Conidiobolus coronatus NRRL 28638]|eukprot:KXN67703.1 hypothetical protein CONCODRAFT_80031 [Conidiobolus coronatus NRRL 28638]
MYLSNIPKFMDSYEEEGLDIDFSLYFSNISIEFNTKTERFSIINCDDFIDSERLYQSLNHEEIQKFQSLVQNYIIEKFKENEFKIIQLTIDIPFEYIHPNNNIDKLYRDALFRPCNSQKFIIFLNCAELMGFWNFTNCIDQGIQAWSMINLKYHFYSYNLYIPNFNPVYKVKEFKYALIPLIH